MASEYFTLSNSISILAKNCVKHNLCKLVTSTCSIPFQSPFLKFFSQNTPDKARRNPFSTERFTSLPQINFTSFSVFNSLHRQKHTGGERKTEKM